MSDKLERSLQHLLQDPIEQHFEPLDEFTTYRLAAQAVKASHALNAEPQRAQDTTQQTPSAINSQRLLMAAAAMLLCGAVGIGAWSFGDKRAHQAPTPAAAVAVAPTPSSPSTTSPPSPARVQPDKAPALGSVGHDLDTSPEAPAPELVVAPTPAKPKRVTPSPHTPPQASSAAPQHDATWWIERAGAFELEQDWARAEDAYKKAIEAKPEPTTLSFAHVALGNIYQRHLHQPAQALKHYEGYLSHARQGALAHEALLGSIWALKALGRPLDEARQIKRLIKEHPQSPSAQALKTRLQEIYAQPLE